MKRSLVPTGITSLVAHQCDEYHPDLRELLGHSSRGSACTFVLLFVAGAVTSLPAFAFFTNTVGFRSFTMGSPVE